jgi:hypothetical protein
MGYNNQSRYFRSRITGTALHYSDAANTITAPEGQSIIGIQFMGATVLSALIANDSTKSINGAASAHSTGSFTRTVNMSDVLQLRLYLIKKTP